MEEGNYILIKIETIVVIQLNRKSDTVKKKRRLVFERYKITSFTTLCSQRFKVNNILFGGVLILRSPPKIKR